MTRSIFLENSLCHAMHHFGLNGAVTEVLSIKVLRFVAHAVASVANDRNLHFGVVRHLVLLTVLVRSHGDLETSRHGLVFLSCAHIAVLQARPHWVNVEEGVLAVLNVCHGLPVEGLMTLVADGWQV